MPTATKKRKTYKHKGCSRPLRISGSEAEAARAFVEMDRNAKKAGLSWNAWAVALLLKQIGFKFRDEGRKSGG